MKKNINDKLQEIIIAHNIDRFHPNYKKCIQAIAYLKEYFSQFGKETLLLVTSSETDRKYMEEDFSLYNCLVIDYDNVDTQAIEAIKKDKKEVIIASYYRRRELISSLGVYGIKAVSIYDYLAIKGLVLDGNYYDIFGEQYSDFISGKNTFDYSELDINSIFFYDRRCYEIADNQLIEEMYLTRMIFDCIYSKNFILAQKYIQEYTVKNFSDAALIQQGWNEIVKLLESIKLKLSNRKTEDIIMFWLDQLEYGEDNGMPFLKSMNEKSLDFENAYTVTPYTHATAKALLSGKYIVDDRSYKDRINKQSKFIKNIESRGYRFKFYTCLNDVETSIKGCKVLNEYTPISQICWNVLSDMLDHSAPLCAIVHEIFQTHSPFVSFGLSGSEYSYKEIPGKELTSLEKELRKIQKNESKKYVDNILEFYYELLPPEVFKIYMSDHGHSGHDRWHTIFRVVQKNIQPKKVKKVFSYINFEKLIFNMLNGDKQLDSIASDYAYIQDIDYYDKLYLKEILSEKYINLKNVFGHKGIVTEKDKYIRYNDGRVLYMNRDSNGNRVTREREEYLANFVTEYPKDLIEDDKFRYTRYAYKTRENYYKRNGVKEKRKRELVKDLFNTIPKGSVVAIRGGGYHTMGMWSALEWPQRNKINYIIDYDEECIASRFGLEIILPQDIDKRKIDIIILSSFEYEDIWYKELKEQIKDVKIVKLYSFLRDHEIICNGPFYWEDILSEDAVWED